MKNKIEFINHLKERHREFTTRWFHPLELKNGYSISIQASEFHYCNPRQTLDPDKYTTMEIAIFNRRGSFFNVKKSRSKFIKDKEWLKLFESGSSPVAGYVPIETIQEIIDNLGGII
jgi:hypothetical protein